MMNPDRTELQYRSLKVGTLRVFGGLQIALGILCVLLSIAGVVVESGKLHKYCDWDGNWDDNDCREVWQAPTLLSMNITSLILAGWGILTGCFPFCMNRNRQVKWRCLKITFMVLCIIGASLLIPAVMVLGIVGSLITAYGTFGSVLVLDALVAVAAFVQWVTAIIAASICCCCSSLNGSPGQMYVASGQPGNVFNAATAPPYMISGQWNPGPTSPGQWNPGAVGPTSSGRWNLGTVAPTGPPPGHQNQAFTQEEQRRYNTFPQNENPPPYKS